jgi:hypothetical protein
MKRGGLEIKGKGFGMSKLNFKMTMFIPKFISSNFYKLDITNCDFKKKRKTSQLLDSFSADGSSVDNRCKYKVK